MAVLYEGTVLAPGSRTGPIRVSAAHLFGRAQWRLELGPDGSCTVSTRTATKRCSLDGEQRDKLVSLVKSQEFFSLRKYLGQMGVDEPVRIIEIQIDSHQHEVTLGSRFETESDREQIKRPLRVWLALKGLCEIDDPLDTRKEDQRFIDDEDHSPP
jgi:hypothetical protein